MGAPPEYNVLIEAKCSADAPGARYRALKTVIEPIVNVTPCSTKASRVTSGWNRLANTSAHSRTSATTALITAPVMWKSGATANTTSPSASPTKSP